MNKIYEFTTTYKCLNCNELITIDTFIDKRRILSRFKNELAEFLPFVKADSNIYIHRCKDGRYGNCIELYHELKE